MDLYTFAATAIPVLWAACQFVQRHQLQSVQKWPSAFWFMFKATLIAGEVSAVVTIGRGRDDLLGAWTCAVAMIAGGLVVVAPSLAKDFSRLGLRGSGAWWSSILSAAFVGWLALRLA
jgi:hypothetical protein